MGGDGGVIATKRKFVRGAKNPDDHVDPKNIRQHQVVRSRVCALSSQPLREPIVCCEMGNLYNREAILSALLEKTLQSAFAHLRGLKDVKTIQFTPNEKYDVSLEAEGEMPAMFICPITKMEFNGIHPFVVIWPTGCALSEKAVREIGIDELQAEYGPFREEDLIKLIPVEEHEVAAQRVKMIWRRQQKKAAKQGKQQKTDNKAPMVSQLGEIMSEEGKHEPFFALSDSGKRDTSSSVVDGEASLNKDSEPTNNESSSNIVGGASIQQGTKKLDHKHAKELVRAMGGMLPAEQQQQHQHKKARISSSTTTTITTSAGNGVVKTLGASAGLAESAKRVVEGQQAQSKVYSSLFHKEGEKDRTANDLMMTVAGLRYTLG